MVGNLRKRIYDILVNKVTITMLFWVFSVLPLVTSDIILRYVLNPIYISNFLYNLVPILFNACWIIFVVYTCRYILPKKVGRIIYVVFTILFGMWFFANFISFKMFSRYLWFESVLLASEASDYISVVGQYIDIKVILVGIIYIGSTIITCILWGESRIKNRVIRAIPVMSSLLGVILINTFMNIAIAEDKADGAWEVWDKPTLVYDKFTDANKSLNISGLYQYTFKSIYKALSTETQISAELEEETDNYFSAKQAKVDNEMTGILKDKNIIFVLMESMDHGFINEKYTPTLKYMMENGINFTNHYMPHVGMGYTFNAEFAANTGYYCPNRNFCEHLYQEHISFCTG